MIAHLRLTAIGDAPPAQFRIFAAGVNQTTKGAFIFDATAAASVMADYAKHGADIMLDLEHLSVDDTAPHYDPDARGWAKLELRKGELWAVDVKWTPDGEARLRQKRQRYISPAFCADKTTKRIVSLLNVAITSLPATDGLDPLVKASGRDDAPDQTYAALVQTRDGLLREKNEYERRARLREAAAKEAAMVQLTPTDLEMCKQLGTKPADILALKRRQEVQRLSSLGDVPTPPPGTYPNGARVVKAADGAPIALSPAASDALCAAAQQQGVDPQALLETIVSQALGIQTQSTRLSSGLGGNLSGDMGATAAAAAKALANPGDGSTDALKLPPFLDQKIRAAAAKQNITPQEMLGKLLAEGLKAIKASRRDSYGNPLFLGGR